MGLEEYQVKDNHLIMEVVITMDIIIIDYIDLGIIMGIVSIMGLVGSSLILNYIFNKLLSIKNI